MNKQLTLDHTPWDGGQRGSVVGEEADTLIAEELVDPIQPTLRSTLRSLNQVASRLGPAAEKPSLSEARSFTSMADGVAKRGKYFVQGRF